MEDNNVFYLNGGNILIEIEIVESIIKAKIPGVYLRVGTKMYQDPEYGDNGIILVWDPLKSTILRVVPEEHKDVTLLVPPELEDIYEDLPVISYLWFDNYGHLVSEIKKEGD